MKSAKYKSLRMAIDLHADYTVTRYSATESDTDLGSHLEREKWAQRKGRQHHFFR